MGIPNEYFILLKKDGRLEEYFNDRKNFIKENAKEIAKYNKEKKGNKRPRKKGQTHQNSKRSKHSASTAPASTAPVTAPASTAPASTAPVTAPASTAPALREMLDNLHKVANLKDESKNNSEQITALDQQLETLNKKLNDIVEPNGDIVLVEEEKKRIETYYGARETNIRAAETQRTTDETAARDKENAASTQADTVYTEGVRKLGEEKSKAELEAKSAFSYAMGLAETKRNGVVKKNEEEMRVFQQDIMDKKKLVVDDKKQEVRTIEKKRTILVGNQQNVKQELRRYMNVLTDLGIPKHRLGPNVPDDVTSESNRPKVNPSTNLLDDLASIDGPGQNQEIAEETEEDRKGIKKVQDGLEKSIDHVSVGFDFGLTDHGKREDDDEEEPPVVKKEDEGGPPKKKARVDEEEQQASSSSSTTDAAEVEVKKEIVISEE